MIEIDENSIRKAIWARKDAVDAKMAEIQSEDIPADERDAWIISLQLGVAFETAARCLAGTAKAEELAEVREKIAEIFKYGKRKALRALKEALGRHEGLAAEKV